MSGKGTDPCAATKKLVARTGGPARTPGDARFRVTPGMSATWRRAGGPRHGLKRAQKKPGGGVLATIRAVPNQGRASDAERLQIISVRFERRRVLTVTGGRQRMDELAVQKVEQTAIERLHARL